MYTVNLANGYVTRDSDGALIEPANSPSDPGYIEYMQWLSAGNAPTEVNIPEPEVPEEVTRFQALAALDEFGLLDSVQAALSAPGVPRRHRLAFDNAQVFRFDSELVQAMGAALGITRSQLAQLFIRASQIEV